MNSGWVPPLVSAVKEYGQVTGHIVPSYIRMCAKQLLMLLVALQVTSRWVLVMLQVALQVFCTWAAD